MRRSRTSAAGCLFAAVFAFAAQGAPVGREILFAEHPALSPDGSVVYFAWADLVWKASSSGGEAVPVTGGTDRQDRPVVSPDGSRLAFQSTRDGDWKVFELDLASGVQRQVTFSSLRTRPCQYSADGAKLLCQGARGRADGDDVAFVDLRERKAEEFVCRYCEGEPRLSPDGKTVLFMRNVKPTPYIRGLRSSFASQIWSYDVETKEYRLVVARETESRSPMWRPDGGAFYYVSGEGGTMNLVERAYPGGEERHLTFFEGDPVVDPALSADGRTMVFRQGFGFWRIDPMAERPEPVAVRHSASCWTPRPPVRRRFYSEVWNNDSPGDIAFTDEGSTMALTTGGDLFIMDDERKSPRLLHGSSLTHERECVWSPDGNVLYYLSDRGDGIDVWKAERSDPKAKWWECDAYVRTRLTTNDVYREALKVSPDGSRLSWRSLPVGLVVASTNGKPVVEFPMRATERYCWSGDGKWIAAQVSDSCDNDDIWILDVSGKRKPFDISCAFGYEGCPAWSPDSTTLAWVGDNPDTGKGLNLFYVRFGETNAAGAVEIGDFETLRGKVRRVDRQADYPFWTHDSKSVCFWSGNGTYKVSVGPDGAGDAEKVSDKKGRFRGWFQGGKRLCRIIGNKPARNDEIVQFKAYQETNVADYRELGLRIAWARLRDGYYDEDMHGVDWTAVRDKYVGAARAAPTPSAYLNVLTMMFGELSSSHLGAFESDASRREWTRRMDYDGWKSVTQSLGVEFEAAEGGDGWKVTRVLEGGPAEKAKPGLCEGDVIVAVDGTRIVSGLDPTVVLNGFEGRMVAIEAKGGADGKMKTVRLAPQDPQKARRQMAAAEDAARRKRVHEASGGRLGYIKLSAMKDSDFREFMKEFYPETCNKEGLVIDVRDNTGGNISDKILDLICRDSHSYVRRRGVDEPVPAFARPRWQHVFMKPVVTLANARTFSNGEVFTHTFKALRRGKVVGEKTGGNVISTFDKPLLDLGTYRLPSRGMFLLDGTDMEGHGAEPDIVVPEDLTELANGTDVQLETAIKLLLEECDRNKAESSPVKLKYDTVRRTDGINGEMRP